MHTAGTGNPTLSEEMTALRMRTSKQDAKMGKTRQQAAVFAKEDLEAVQREARDRTVLWACLVLFGTYPLMFGYVPNINSHICFGTHSKPSCNDAGVH